MTELRPVRLTLGLEDGRLIVLDAAKAVDCTIPIRFDDEAIPVGAYHLPAGRETPVRMGSFVGSVVQGGPVDCMELTIFPHGNGTHTECAGHISHGHRTVGDLHLGLRAATLVTVTPTPLGTSGESYPGTSASDDLVVTRAALSAGFGAALGPLCEGDLAFAQVLVVRTLPNDVEAKRAHNHSGRNPPYFTHEALVHLCTRGVRHIVVDLPSLDREQDGGTTPNHRTFFGLAESGPDEQLALLRAGATITELAAVPDALPDGRVVAEIAVAPIDSDAAPSRVTLYPIEVVAEPGKG